MRRFILFFIFVGIVIELFSQDIPFKFDSKRIQVGALYIYEFYENKESKPESYVYYYVKRENEIEEIPLKEKDSGRAPGIGVFKMN